MITRRSLLASGAGAAGGLLLPQTARALLVSRGGGGSSYTAKAVHFDGSTWLAIPALTTADSPLVTFSGWAKASITGAPHSWLFYDLDPTNREAGPYIDNNTLNVGNQFDSGSGQRLTSLSADNAWTNGSWHHVFGYADTNHPAGSKIVKLFLDTVDITGTVADDDAAFLMPFSSVGLAIPDTTEDFPTPEFTGDYADWYIAPGVLETDITIFRDPVTGKPNDPAGFPSSAVLFSGDATGFAINQGTGGAFTLTGVLTNASTSPSD